MNCEEERDWWIVLKDSGNCVDDNEDVIQIALITYGIADSSYMQINEYVIY